MDEDNAARHIARTAELLWGGGQARKRGPKPRLSLDKIVRAAITIADADGLAAVSMQRVAAELGYTSMSLYTYVPNKDLLLEAMLDTVAADHEPALGDFPDWRAELHSVVADMWTMFESHPWALHVQVVGPPIGPGQMSWFERFLSTLDKAGLPPDELASVGMYLLAAIRGLAKVFLDMRALSDSPIDAHATDAAADDMLHQFADPARFPFITAAYGQPSSDTAWYRPGVVPDDLRLGTDRLLDGIEAHVARGGG